MSRPTGPSGEWERRWKGEGAEDRTAGTHHGRTDRPGYGPGLFRGVDSSLLLKMAADRAAKKGTKVWAVTFNSRLHPSCDLENARKVAEELGGIHVILEIDELEMEEIRSNPVNRCYLCKRNLFRTLMAFAKEKGVEVLAEGTNEDDLHVYRPGIQAVRELGIRSPLAEAGLTKGGGAPSGGSLRHFGRLPPFHSLHGHPPTLRRTAGL